MKIEVLDQARDDLRAGREFYDRQETGIGAYFISSLVADIDSLRLLAGVHTQHFGFHRALSHRFPFGIFYRIEGSVVRIYAILDLRRDPAWIRRRITGDR